MEQKCSINYTQSQINKVTKKLISFFSYCQIFTLKGDLGVGKTTLVKSLLKEVGVNEVITSPTYTYMCFYQNSKGQKFYHFDLYRIESLSEFIELGLDEYLYEPDSWCFIEWPEVIMPLIYKKACYSNIIYKSNERTLEYSFSKDIRLCCK